MKHFDLTDWSDFVRGVERAGGPRLDEMERHLAGCERCTASVKWLREVVRAARADAALEVPEAVVRNAKAAFPASSAGPSVGARIASLVFDSFTGPVPAFGFRSAGTGHARQLRFAMDDYLVDLRLDPAGKAQQWLVTGQLSSGAPARGLPVKVHVVTGKRMERPLEASLSGEFQLELAESRELKLRLLPEGSGVAIDVPLGPFLSAQPKQQS